MQRVTLAHVRLGRRLGLEPRVAQRHALLFAAGRLPRLPFEQMFYLQDSSHVSNPPVYFGIGHRVGLEWERHVVVLGMDYMYPEEVARRAAE
jgi:hypothetical protein